MLGTDNFESSTATIFSIWTTASPWKAASCEANSTCLMPLTSSHLVTLKAAYLYVSKWLFQ